MNYPTVMSTPEIEKLFPGVYALPTSFILDRDGKLVQKHVGMLTASLTEVETQRWPGLAPEIARRVDAEDEDKRRALANAAQANKIPGVDLAGLVGESAPRR